MVTCTRKIHFCSGHRLMGHEGGCRFLHGHNYVAWVTAAIEGEGLDTLGRVVDFSILKERIGGWIDEHWDHGFLLAQADLEGWAAIDQMKDQKSFAMASNPTAENMADFLLREIGPNLMRGSGVHVVKVVLFETENCYAEATL